MTENLCGNLTPVEFTENESLEIHLLLEAVFLKYGYDFRNYAKASIRRRINKHLSTSGLQTIAELQHQVLHEEDAFDQLLRDLSINVTEMFRDPSFFEALRRDVLPQFEKQPHLRIWHAGCATGEEVYSMAILLHEAGMYERSLIYATDLNEAVIQDAREGIYPVGRLQDYTANYQKAGGSESFADYYTARYESVIMRSFLKENIVFSAHNLVTDGAFNEMDIIVCRNVLIYFDRTLQGRIFRLFSDSLVGGGVLCIGTKESVRFSSCAKEFSEFGPGERIYRKKVEGGE